MELYDVVRKIVLILWKFWYFLIMIHISTVGIVMELLERHKKFNIEFLNKKGQVAIITGGTRGIGSEVVKKLLKSNMHVIIGCRNPKAGEDFIEKLRKVYGITKGKVECIQLDLMSLKSVRNFVKSFEQTNLPLHLLINNAGIMFAPYKLTEDNLESHFQVNYLSHFLLTILLLPKLHSTGSKVQHSRIVNVSGGMYEGGSVNFSDLQMRKAYSPYKAYMDTKLMQIISSTTFERLCIENNLHVHNYSLHPGVIMTDLSENMMLIGRFVLKLFGPFLKTNDQGADCTLYASLSPSLDKIGGVYLHNSKITKSPIHDVKDPIIQQNLWEISSQLTGITESIVHF